MKLLDGIWVSTEYHHWHHSDDKAARDKNYAGALPVMDKLFETYYLPTNSKPGLYGVEGHMPASYIGQLFQPFRRDNCKKKHRRQLEESAFSDSLSGKE